MGTTYRYIADPDEPSEVLAWFRALASPPEEIETKNCYALYFTNEGSLGRDANGEIVEAQSPLVALFFPRTRREMFWTVGEVHFLPTPLRKNFPGLHKINNAFKNWLSNHECIFSNKPGFQNEWNKYWEYLKGSVKNYDPPVYAFPSGLTALQTGQYFVCHDDSEVLLSATRNEIKRG